VNTPLYVEIGPLLLRRLTGIARFTARLVEALAERVPLRLISIVERRDARRDHLSTALVWGEEIAIERGSLPAADGDVADWSRAVLSRPRRLLDRAALENSACLYSLLRPEARRFAREVGVLYDFTPLLLPETHEAWVRDLFGRSFTRTLASNDAVLAISESTKFDAGWLSPCAPERVAVCRPGPSLCVHGHASPRPVERAPNLLLVVATREPRKNAGRVLDWFLRASTLPPGTDLLWVGPKGWAWSLRSTLRYRSPGGGTFRFAGEVSDVELCELYRRASLTIYPSLYEGFGFPVLDSLLHGTPVACSFNSSLKEFAGPGVAYFDPYDSASLDSAAREALSAPRDFERADLRETCSWQKAAERVLRAMSDEQ
jgi:glycosyltransferase involved in cell wall biosynthesis